MILSETDLNYKKNLLAVNLLSGSAVYTKFGFVAGAVVQCTKYNRPNLNTCTVHLG